MRGFATYSAAYDAGCVVATGADDVFGVVKHGKRFYVELASRETGSPVCTLLEMPRDVISFDAAHARLNAAKIAYFTDRTEEKSRALDAAIATEIAAARISGTRRRPDRKGRA